MVIVVYTEYELKPVIVAYTISMNYKHGHCSIHYEYELKPVIVGYTINMIEPG